MTSRHTHTMTSYDLEGCWGGVVVVVVCVCLCMCEDAVLKLNETVVSDPQLTSCIQVGKPLPDKTLFYLPLAPLETAAWPSEQGSQTEDEPSPKNVSS